MTTDSEIIRRSLADPRVFAELFDRHARVIGAYARQRSGADASQDILSETFLVAFRRRGSFELARESARPWLLGIATKLIARHRAAEAAQWRSIVAASSVIATGADDIEAAADRVDAWSELRVLAPRIAGLSARDRDTLLLYAWGDLGYAEVAECLSVPVGTVRSRLNRVRRLLGDGRAELSLTGGEDSHGLQ
ncbi:sigma-70 family RNA polymerase sigma factor [Planococcus sp. APC 4015]|nr:sigma-70 family RNA polymerase sigma factor [Planococcus sp. APC 4015]